MVDSPPSRAPMTREEKKVILASSLGTIFEWYDFYLYGALAAMIGAHFFSSFDPTTRNVFSLLAFAAGFLVRPFGALVFGRVGDLVGRKYTFLVTIVIMGTSTFLVGLLPGYDTLGWVAPVCLIGLRMLQGLALGGEYGGAAVYVAEHAPHGRRGFYTSFIQTTATLGLLLSLLVILSLRRALGEADFAAWGWRAPFLLSAVLLGVSVWIRLQMQESPAFLSMKAEGKQSKAPLSEAFGTWKNVRVVVAALLGLVAGQAVVWYTGQFYALFFLQSILKVDLFTANVLVAWSLILGSGGFLFFGALSDRVGRKPVILGGCVVAALTFFPIFHQLLSLANPRLEAATRTVHVEVIADAATCGSVFDPVGIRTFTEPCDIARVALARAAVPYQLTSSAGVTRVVVAGRDVPIAATVAASMAAFSAAAVDAGYPAAGDASIVKVDGFFAAWTKPVAVKLIGLLLLLVLYVTAVYGPIAAALVELFPTRIRYTAMSLPYHIGNGWFGGFLPPMAFAMVAATGDISFGLWYPIVVVIGGVIVGLLFVPETRHRDILTWDTPSR